MNRILFSLGLVVVGLAVGYLFQVLVNQGRLSNAPPLDTLRKTLQRTALLVLNPIAILGATWVADLGSVRIAAMPFLGLFALFWGGILAYAAARMFGFANRQTGAYVVCGGFTNIGSLGALFCFIFLGEQGFALVPFYKLFEEFAYYAVGFPVAKGFSRDVAGAETWGSRMRKVWADPFVLAAASGIGTGLILNLSGVPRPPVYASVNAVLIPLAALLLLISIGMAMGFKRVVPLLKPAGVIAGIKFFLVPLSLAGLAVAAGLHHIQDGLPLKVVLILSSMPVGFIAMVPPTLYDLDIDLANACWLLTNAWLLVQVPLLMVVLRMI
ncbi:MAG: hypothetical protein V6Z89_01465 [Desulfobacter sp.]